jgi:hypothetical protein
MCALIGIAYASAPELRRPPIGGWLATLAALGAAALVAASIWQLRADGGTRTLVLVLLSVLASGFVAANVLALVAAEGGVPGVPHSLHVFGAAAGSALYVDALVDASLNFVRRVSNGRSRA